MLTKARRYVLTLPRFGLGSDVHGVVKKRFGVGSEVPWLGVVFNLRYQTSARSMSRMNFSLNEEESEYDESVLQLLCLLSLSSGA